MRSRIHEAFRMAVESTAPVHPGTIATDRAHRLIVWAQSQAHQLERARFLAADLPGPDRLRVARELAGLSRKQAASALNRTWPTIHTHCALDHVDDTQIAAMEAGEDLRPAIVEVLADVYDVPLEWLRGNQAPEWLAMLLVFRVGGAKEVT